MLSFRNKITCFDDFAGEEKEAEAAQGKSNECLLQSLFSDCWYSSSLVSAELEANSTDRLRSLILVRKN